MNKCASTEEVAMSGSALNYGILHRSDAADNAYLS